MSDPNDLDFEVAAAKHAGKVRRRQRRQKQEAELAAKIEGILASTVLDKPVDVEAQQAEAERVHPKGFRGYD